MFDPEFMEPMPEKLRGVFFCEGDIRLEDCTTFEYSRWDPENLTLLVYPFFPNTVTYPGKPDWGYVCVVRVTSTRHTANRRIFVCSHPPTVLQLLHFSLLPSLL